jgi:hypothetical protein
MTCIAHATGKTLAAAGQRPPAWQAQPCRRQSHGTMATGVNYAQPPPAPVSAGRNQQRCPNHLWPPSLGPCQDGGTTAAGRFPLSQQHRDQCGCDGGVENIPQQQQRRRLQLSDQPDHLWPTGGNWCLSLPVLVCHCGPGQGQGTPTGSRHYGQACGQSVECLPGPQIG